MINIQNTERILLEVVRAIFKQQQQNSVFFPSLLGLYFEPEPVSSTPGYFHPREFSSCVSCEENTSCIDQIFDAYLQTETHPDPSLSSMQNAPHYFPDSFQAAPFCVSQSLVIYLRSLQNLPVARSGVLRLC